ncbi:hypothetical protein HDU91_002355, partial [Kappamyces sp. JEL0680]
LGFLDRFLSLWILLAMVGGTLVGVYSPGVKDVLNAAIVVDQVSLAVFLGLFLMLYPVFCKVQYEELSGILQSRLSVSYLITSLLLNWVVCPLLMAGLAWAFLPDLPAYRVGVMLIGVARCIAMVLIWNDLAGGHQEWCAVLMAMNSILQIILFAPLGYFYTAVLNQELGQSIDMWLVAKNVLLFLGVPFAAGFLTRLCLRFGLRAKLGVRWYDKVFVSWVSPLALLGLLYTIFIMFALQIGPVCRVMLPLVCYFGLAWFGTLALCAWLQFPFPIAVTQSFTAASNNFELAMAVAIAIWGVDSQEALATTTGPLIEVPVMMALVYVVPSANKWYQ